MALTRACDLCNEAIYSTKEEYFKLSMIKFKDRIEPPTVGAVKHLVPIPSDGADTNSSFYTWEICEKCQIDFARLIRDKNTKMVKEATGGLSGRLEKYGSERQ